MFRKIARLLFGAEEENPEEVKSGEVAEDGWLVLSHQAGGGENQDASLAAAQQCNSTSQADTPTNTEKNSPPLAEPTVPPRGSTAGPTVASYVSQPKAVGELTRVTCSQRAKSWTDRRHVSRSAIQRQNQVHQVAHHNTFHLQQPGVQSLSH